MPFTKANARDLGEIKALAQAHNESIKEVLDRLGRIDEVELQHRAARNEARTPLAFVHIPKTAGATATTMLARAYSARAVHDAGNYMKGPKTTAQKLSKLSEGWEAWLGGGGRVCAGHVPYHVFRRHLPPDVRYITFLREPVDRVISHYFRHIHRPHLTAAQRRERAERGNDTAVSLDEALVELRLPQIRNLATRFLCGHSDPQDELPPNALETAKANLRNFMFVGVQERFEESIILLQRTLGLELVPYLNVHVSEDRPSVDDISDEQRALIQEHNQLDAELHRFGRKLFEDAVAASGPGFAHDVEELRALSTEANVEVMEKARAWLDRELPVGTTRDSAQLRRDARAAGVTLLALKRLLKDLGLKSKPDGDGSRIITRTETEDSPVADPPR